MPYLARAYSMPDTEPGTPTASQPAGQWSLRLPVPDGSVDGVTCGFALRNFAALEPFFAELGSPGGASKVGLTENDPQVVKDLPPKEED